MIDILFILSQAVAPIACAALASDPLSVDELIEFEENRQGKIFLIHKL